MMTAMAIAMEMRRLMFFIWKNLLFIFLSHLLLIYQKQKYPKINAKILRYFAYILIIAHFIKKVKVNLTGKRGGIGYPLRNHIKNKPQVASFPFMVVAAGFEPAIAWMKTMCPRPLDDATNMYILYQTFLKFARVMIVDAVICPTVGRGRENANVSIVEIAVVR